MLLMSDPTYEYRIVRKDGTPTIGGQDARTAEGAFGYAAYLNDTLATGPDSVRVERRLVGVWEPVEGDKS